MKQERFKIEDKERRREKERQHEYGLKQLKKGMWFGMMKPQYQKNLCGMEEEDKIEEQHERESVRPSGTERWKNQQQRYWKLEIKLPKFIEGQISMEGFLRSFEALTTSWDDNKGKGQCLRGQLSRGAVEVVNRLRTGQSNSYEKMKEALLRRYECNQEGYKRKFNKNKPKKGESFSMYIDKSADYLANWF